MPRKPPEPCEMGSRLYALTMEAWLEQELIEAEEEQHAGRLSPDELTSVRRSIGQALAELETIMRQTERNQNRGCPPVHHRIRPKGNEDIRRERTQA